MHNAEFDAIYIYLMHLLSQATAAAEQRLEESARKHEEELLRVLECRRISEKVRKRYTDLKR